MGYDGSLRFHHSLPIRWSAALLLGLSLGAAPLAPRDDAPLPRHVRAFAFYGLNDINADVPPAYMAAHVDIVEDDGFTAQHADAFKRAGGATALAYTDPSYVPHCPPPFKPPVGKCEGPVGNLVATDERAFFHDANGERVRRYNDPYFQYQEALNVASPIARDAYRRTTDAILAHSPRLDGFLADDSGSPYSGDSLGSNWFYGFNAPAVEIRDEKSFIAAEIAMLAAAGKPVLFNGGDPHTLGPAYDGLFLRLPFVLGQEFEGCYNNVDGTLFGDERNDRFARQSNGLIAVMAAHRLALCLPTGPADPARRTYAYASFMLSYDPRWSVYGMEHKLSDGRAIFPEIELVPGSPRETARAIADLKHGRVYVREFERCALAGASIGPCAAVVNPSHADSAVPPLAARYARHAELDTASQLGGGRVRLVAGAPAALGPVSAAILFR